MGIVADLIGPALAYGIVCFATIAAVPTVASAQKTDTLVLYNGDVITGEIRSLRHGRLSYKTDDMGTLSVEWDKVARLWSAQEHEAIDRSGRRLFGSIQQAAVDGLFVVNSDTLSLRQIVDITPIEAGFFHRTDGFVDLGFTIAKANKARTFNFNWEGNYRGRRWGGTIHGSSYLQQQEDADRTTRNTGALQVSRFISGKLAGLIFAEFTQNDELNLDLRVNAGGGVDWRLVRNNQIDFGIVGGALVNRERFSDSDASILSAELVAQFDFSAFRYDSPELDLSATLTPYLSVTKLGRVRADLVVRWTYEVFSDFHLGITFRDAFDSEPPDTGELTNDYTATFTIGWSWN